MDPKKQEAGRMGGLATWRRHGKEHYVAMGKKGGRPRALTLEDILRQKQSQEAARDKENKTKEENGYPSALSSMSLKQLKRLYRLRQHRSTGDPK